LPLARFSLYNSTPSADPAKLPVACIVLVCTAEKSQHPHVLVYRTIKLLQARENFAKSIKKSVTDARSKFPHKDDRGKLVDWLVEIVMKEVDSLPAVEIVMSR
jgi:hypothetical protein